MNLRKIFFAVVSAVVGLLPEGKAVGALSKAGILKTYLFDLLQATPEERVNVTLEGFKTLFLESYAKMTDAEIDAVFGVVDAAMKKQGGFASGLTDFLIMLNAPNLETHDLFPNFVSCYERLFDVLEEKGMITGEEGELYVEGTDFLYSDGTLEYVNTEYVELMAAEEEAEEAEEATDLDLGALSDVATVAAPVKKTIVKKAPQASQVKKVVKDVKKVTTPAAEAVVTKKEAGESSLSDEVVSLLKTNPELAPTIALYGAVVVKTEAVKVPPTEADLRNALKKLADEAPLKTVKTILNKNKSFMPVTRQTAAKTTVSLPEDQTKLVAIKTLVETAKLATK